MDQRRIRRIASLSLLVCGAVFIVIGIARGDMAAVFRKAVFICMECIGIG
jgi:hypothetical protein